MRIEDEEERLLAEIDRLRRELMEVMTGCGCPTCKARRQAESARDRAKRQRRSEGRR